jgi:hypothetical protein
MTPLERHNAYIAMELFASAYWNYAWAHLLKVSTDSKGLARQRAICAWAEHFDSFLPNSQYA